MPQLPAVLPHVPPSTPQALPPGSSGDSDASHFSPHLDRAISGKNLGRQTAHGTGVREKSCDTDQKNLPATEQAPERFIDSEQTILTTLTQSTEKTPNFTDKTSNYNDLSATESPAAIADQKIADENLEQGFLFPFVPENFLQFPSFFLTRLSPAEVQATQAGNPSAAIASQAVSFSLSPEAEFAPKQPDTTPAGAAKVVPFLFTVSPETKAEISAAADSKQTTPVAVGKQETLLSQLQQIIASSREMNTEFAPKAASPSIKIAVAESFYSSLNASLAGKTETAGVSANAQTAVTNQNGLPLADGDSLAFTPAKPLHHLTGSRHDGQQQLFATKTSGEPLTDNGQNFQNSQQEGDLAQQAPGSTLPGSPFSTLEQTTTFSTMAALAQEINTNPTAESAKPILLPSGVIVHEHEVMQQLAEKFHLSGKNIDSRINLTLHPVELGELKIDLTLKEGAIRANIVAQSQHTLEILEKNLPKLKTMLENQGLEIDQIELAAESESVTDFDLFDRQLFGNNDQPPAPQKGRLKQEGEFILDDIPFTAPATNAGVNVKI